MIWNIICFAVGVFIGVVGLASLSISEYRKSDESWKQGYDQGYEDCMEGINREGQRILAEASMMRSIFSRATKLEEGLKRLIREGEENAN